MFLNHVSTHSEVLRLECEGEGEAGVGGGVGVVDAGDHCSGRTAATAEHGCPGPCHWNWSLVDIPEIIINC